MIIYIINHDFSTPVSKAFFKTRFCAQGSQKKLFYSHFLLRKILQDVAYVGRIMQYNHACNLAFNFLSLEPYQNFDFFFIFFTCRFWHFSVRNNYFFKRIFTYCAVWNHIVYEKPQALDFRERKLFQTLEGYKKTANIL